MLLVVGVGSGPARALGVPFEESLPRALLPEPDPRFEALELLRALGAEVHHGRPGGVVERAEHPRHISQRRVFPAPLGEGPGRLSFEVYDLEVVAHHEHLPEVVITVMPGLYDAEASSGDVLYAPCQLPAQSQEPVRVGDHLLRQPVPATFEHVERTPELRDYSLGPAGHLLGRRRLRGEGRVVGGRGEGRVQLAGSQP